MLYGWSLMPMRHVPPWYVPDAQLYPQPELMDCQLTTPTCGLKYRAYPCQDELRLYALNQADRVVRRHGPVRKAVGCPGILLSAQVVGQLGERGVERPGSPVAGVDEVTAVSIVGGSPQRGQGGLGRGQELGLVVRGCYPRAALALFLVPVQPGEIHSALAPAGVGDVRGAVRVVDDFGCVRVDAPDVLVPWRSATDCHCGKCRCSCTCCVLLDSPAGTDEQVIGPVVIGDDGRFGVAGGPPGV